MKGGATAPPAVDISDVFNFQLYNGNGSTVTIQTGFDMRNTTGSTMTMQKSRFTTVATQLEVNGPSGMNNQGVLNPTSTAAGVGSTDYITSLTTTGYTIGNYANANTNNQFYMSTVFKQSDGFFKLVTVSVTLGTAVNIDLSSLGAVGMVWVKNSVGTGDWFVWHKDLTANNNLRLNTTAAQTTTNAYLSVSGTTLTLSTTTPTGTYQIFAWAHNTSSDSLVKCGSYTGSGTVNGPTVSLGFEPQYLLIRARNGTGNWQIFAPDLGLPGIGNQVMTLLNSTAAETISARYFRLTADGFRMDAVQTAVNTSGIVYIYMAIPRTRKAPTLGTSVFSPVVYTGTNAANRLLNLGIKCDMAWMRLRAGTGTGNTGFLVGNRIRGQYFVKTQSDGPIETVVATGLDQQLATSERGTAFSSAVGVYIGNDSGTTNVDANINAVTTANGHVGFGFKRAPKFYDSVWYTGTGSTKTEIHNLRVAPEMMIIKRHDSADNWVVWHSGLTSIQYTVTLDTAAGVFGPSSTEFDATLPTSSVFTVGTASTVNASGGTFMAHLFATCPGVSKVGSYVGNGTTQDVDCGFSAGARFLLVKSSGAGDWFVFDSARGMTVGSDPYLATSNTSAEGSADLLAAYAGGFQISAGTPSLNANGVTYIFLAIA